MPHMLVHATTFGRRRMWADREQPQAIPTCLVGKFGFPRSSFSHKQVLNVVCAAQMSHSCSTLHLDVAVRCDVEVP